MLKKNVGKDLSTISFPVSFNCPLSLLQAAAEEYEYASDLLERAGKSQDWVERICLVGAFAVSGYASTKLRASRKPFNPLLGETFECVREDKHFKFLAEKVVHQPPVVAFYAEGKGWKAQGWSAVKNKFWGKSLELIPEGSIRIELGDGDVFSINKPSSFMRNLLAGNKYLEHVGELTVTNESTGQRAVIEFKEGTMWVVLPHATTSKAKFTMPTTAKLPRSKANGRTTSRSKKIKRITNFLGSLRNASLRRRVLRVHLLCHVAQRT